MGYYFCPHTVAHFILQLLNTLIRAQDLSSALLLIMVVENVKSAFRVVTRSRVKIKNNFSVKYFKTCEKT